MKRLFWKAVQYGFFGATIVFLIPAMIGGLIAVLLMQVVVIADDKAEKCENGGDYARFL